MQSFSLSGKDGHMRLRKRSKERLEWLLKYIAATRFDGIIAWDADTVDDFVEAFPESKKTLLIYTLGPNSCPMLNRTAILARDLGYLSPASLGNMDARSYNMRTWCRYWSLTYKGKEYIKAISTVGEQK